MYRPGIRYAKAGIALIDIRPQQFWQHDMFAKDPSHSEKTMKIMDDINKRYGRETLVLGRHVGDKKFSMK